jgi:hypothetical protein
VVLGCFSVVILIMMPISLIIRHNCFNDDCHYTGYRCDTENPQVPVNNTARSDTSSDSERVIFSQSPQDIDGSVKIHTSSSVIVPSPPVSFFAKFREQFRIGKSKKNISSQPISNTEGSHPLNTDNTPADVSNPSAMPYTDSAISTSGPEPASGPQSTPSFLNPANSETLQDSVYQPTIFTSSTPDRTYPKTVFTLQIPPLSPINNSDAPTSNTDLSIKIENPHTNPKSTLLELSDDDDDYSQLPASVWASICRMSETALPATTNTETFDLDLILEDVSLNSPENQSPSYYETQFDEMARSRSQTPDRD